jgi:hypothetical protein
MTYKYTDKTFKELESSDFVKRLDVNITEAEILLCDVFDVLSEKNIKPILVFGTLLGCYRGDGLIPHDHDMDIGIINEDQYFAVKDLIESDRFSIKGIQQIKDREFSLYRNGFYLDIYPFLSYNGFYVSKLGFPHYRLEQKNFPFRLISFLDREFLTVLNVDQYLEERYGKDWNIPNENASGASH